MSTDSEDGPGRVGSPASDERDEMDIISSDSDKLIVKTGPDDQDDVPLL